VYREGYLSNPWFAVVLDGTVVQARNPADDIVKPNQSVQAACHNAPDPRSGLPGGKYTKARWMHPSCIRDAQLAFVPGLAVCNYC
jgi:hypothetical protein